MRYIIRSIKYLLWLIVLCSLLIIVLVLTTKNIPLSKVFDPEVGLFIQEGAAWKMIAFFFAIAAIYPAISFVKKEAFINGTFESNKEKIEKVLDDLGYVLVSENEESITYRIAKPFTRFMRMYEDKVTITKGDSPLIINGFRKDIYRIARGIEYATRGEESDN